MNKRFLRLFSILMTTAIVLSMGLFPASAAEVTNHNCEACSAEETVSPRYNGSCGYCSGGVTYHYCLDTYNIYDTGTHSTLRGTCTVKYYRNQSFMWCSNCGHKSYFSGTHDCAERHSICSYGGDNVYTICPCDYLWYGNSVP